MTYSLTGSEPTTHKGKGDATMKKRVRDAKTQRRANEAVGRAAVALGRLYMATGGKGRNWEKAVSKLAEVIL